MGDGQFLEEPAVHVDAVQRVERQAGLGARTRGDIKAFEAWPCARESVYIRVVKRCDRASQCTEGEGT